MSELEGRLEWMVKSVGCIGEGVLRFKDTAEAWSYNVVHPEETYADALIERMFDKGYLFSERRESEILVTAKELLLNSASACDRREDLFVEYTVYFGEKGIVMHIKDDGPGFDHNAKTMEARQNPHGLTDEQVLGIYSKDYPGGTAMYSLVNFADDFQHNSKGNEVILQFNLSK